MTVKYSENTKISLQVISECVISIFNITVLIVIVNLCFPWKQVKINMRNTVWNVQFKKQIIILKSVKHVFTNT